MSLARSWQSAINDKLTGPMVMNLLKRSPFMAMLMKDKSWIGTGESTTDPDGPRNSYVIEFLGSTIGARKVGGYQTIANTQIADPVRGLVQKYVDFTGTLKVRSKDLRQHKGKDLVKSLFGKLENQSKNIMAGHSNDMEDMIMNGSVISGVTSIADIASGLLTVERPEKFEIGLGVQLSATAASTKGQELFVISVNKNTKKVGFATSLGGSAANLTNYVGGTAAATKICVNGSVSASTGLATEGLASLESILLSSGNGGDSTYLGKTKTAYPFLQAAEVDGSSFNSANFLEKLFELYVTDMKLRVKHPTQEKPKDVFLSPNNFAIASIYLENYKGQYTSNSLSGSNPYGWDGIKVGNGKGSLNLYEVESLKDSIIPVLNMSTFGLVSDGGVEFVKDENNKGNEKYWYPTRTAGSNGGYTWVSDFEFSGQFVCGNPESNGIFYNVNMSL